MTGEPSCLNIWHQPVGMAHSFFNAFGKFNVVKWLSELEHESSRPVPFGEFVASGRMCRSGARWIGLLRPK